MAEQEKNLKAIDQQSIPYFEMTLRDQLNQFKFDQLRSQNQLNELNTPYKDTKNQKFQYQEDNQQIDEQNIQKHLNYINIEQSQQKIKENLNFKQSLQKNYLQENQAFEYFQDS
ncbi:hypothetical protein PPERSA_09433 [Pseudocohnilembus persalinus]|uniref:Uncharacterized protein n=1 Tax=Pseudocohnilembus persalinus TaxID=266149 RepID=A0A0V0Q9J7_PSEPJ|nr:hypothetical protein PPERSA_09433 [Pseudocohnilembus persalinus]|eukprot:KRW98908.1 hypothetical protein PPERSA_09433 [Pseudocohnilembus persalinus]